MHARPNGYFTLVYPSGYGRLQIIEGAPGSWVPRLERSGWGRLARSRFDDVRLAHLGYQAGNPMPLLLTTRSGNAFNTEQLLPSMSNGSSVSDGVVGLDGKLWFVVSGYQQLRVVHQ